MLSKCSKTVDSLTLFEIIYKRIVTLITFTDSLKNVLNQLFFAKLCLLFDVNRGRNVSSSEECLLHTHSDLSLWEGPLIFLTLSVRNYSDSVKARSLRSETIFGIWKPLKKDENAFSFTLQALFLLKIFKFLSCLFSHVRKWLD